MRWGTGIGLFVLCAGIGWVVNQASDDPPGGDSSHSGETIVSGQWAQSAKSGGTRVPKADDPSLDKEKSQPTKVVWVTVSSDLVNPLKIVRGTGLGLDIREKINPGSTSPEAWGAAPRNKQEFELLQKLLFVARASLASLAPQPELIENNEDTIKFRIGEFDSGGIKQKFLSEVSDLMGEERAAILLASSRGVLDSWLFSFGNTATDFSVRKGQKELLGVEFAGGHSIWGGAAISFWSEAYPAMARSVESAKEVWKHSSPPKAK